MVSDSADSSAVAEVDATTSSAALAGAASVDATSVADSVRPGTVINRCSNERKAGALGPAAADGYGTKD